MLLALVIPTPPGNHPMRLATRAAGGDEPMCRSQSKSALFNQHRSLHLRRIVLSGGER
jgi:hypothetical protein